MADVTEPTDQQGLLVEPADSARLWLVRGSMVRFGGTVPVMMLAVLMLYPPSVSSPERTRSVIQLPASPGVVEPPAPSVRVEHELVRLPRPRLPQAGRSRAWRSTRLAMTDRSWTRAPLIVRARRAVVGDGRYKPEPFPRLER